MSYTCTFGGYPHQHELAIEGRICYGLVPRPAPVAPPVRPYEIHQPRITVNQLNYIEKLGGDPVHAAKLTKKEASNYIDKLQRGDVPVSTTSTAFLPKKDDRRVEMLAALLPAVPSGYFATELEDGAKTDFVRISRPKVGSRNYGGAIKIQTQHGPRLEVAGALWASGTFSIYKNSVIEQLMLLVVDYQGCAMRYARKIGKCCRCNTALTDERSRHYGIGPECEKHFPWAIARVDELNDGKSFEQLSYVR